MYTLKPMTERVKTTREKYRSTTPRVDISRYRLITEFYQNNPGLTGQLLRAYAMKYIYENIMLASLSGKFSIEYPLPVIKTYTENHDKNLYLGTIVEALCKEEYKPLLDVIHLKLFLDGRHKHAYN